jgi:AcrR family transcriptional regulator
VPRSAAERPSGGSSQFKSNGSTSDGRRTQQERTEESKEKLLAAAMQLIGERGYRGTTLADIGRRAGVSRGLVTYHFGTKEACVREVLERIRSSAMIFTAVEQSGKRGLDALAQLVEGYLLGYTSRLPGSRAIFVAIVESFTSNPELADLMKQNDESFKGSIKRFLDEADDLGEVPEGIDVEGAAILIMGLLRGVALQWLVDEEAVDFDRLIPQIQRVVADAVRRLPPEAP